MLKTVDRILAGILGLGAAAGHTYGSLAAYANQPITLLWALNASVLGALLAVLHFIRSFRPGDRALGWVLIAPTLFWFGSSLEFGMLIGHPADPRVLAFAVASLGLTIFSLATALAAQRRPSDQNGRQIASFEPD